MLQRSQGRPRASQGRSSQASSQRNSPGDAALDKNVIASAERAVHFLLAHIGARNAPVQDKDLKKWAFQDLKMGRETFKVARSMLNNTFGYDLQEVPGKTKTYIVVNQLSTQDHISLPKSAEPYRIVLSLVLGYIFMNREEVEEKNLKMFLQRMGISDKHNFFGDVNDLLFKNNNSTFVKDQFLCFNSNDRGNFYTWGKRANIEVDRRAVLQFVCEMLDSDPNEWKLHLKDCETVRTGDVDTE